MILSHPETFFLKNKQKVILRRLTHLDACEYILFCKKIALETTHTLHYVGENFYEDRVKERLKHSMDLSWQLEIGGYYQDELISHLWCSKVNPHHPFEQHTMQFSIKILKKFWANDLGTKNLQIMETMAKKIGVKRIQAQVRVSNTIGLNFYRKNGFYIEGVKKEAVLINNQYEDEFYIAKLLNTNKE